jgi:hypothetical protein
VTYPPTPEQQPPGSHPWQPGQPGWGPPAGPPTYAPPANPLRKPGRIPLRLALIFGVIGIALVVIGGVLVAKSPLAKVDGFARVSVASGGGTVQLRRTGNYVGYYETPTDASHHAYVRMQITDSSGRVLPIQLYSTQSSLTYTDGGRFGQALFTFKISAAGSYRVLVRADGAPQGANVAFGESVAHGIVAGVALIIPGILLVIAAIVLLIVGLVRRSRYKRRLRDGPPAQYWQTPSPYYPG